MHYISKNAVQHKMLQTLPKQFIWCHYAHDSPFVFCPHSPLCYFTLSRYVSCIILCTKFHWSFSGPSQRSLVKRWPHFMCAVVAQFVSMAAIMRMCVQTVFYSSVIQVWILVWGQVGHRILVVVWDWVGFSFTVLFYKLLIPGVCSVLPGLGSMACLRPSCSNIFWDRIFLSLLLDYSLPRGLISVSFGQFLLLVWSRAVPKLFWFPSESGYILHSAADLPGSSYSMDLLVLLEARVPVNLKLSRCKTFSPFPWCLFSPSVDWRHSHQEADCLPSVVFHTLRVLYANPTCCHSYWILLFDADLPSQVVRSAL